MFARPRLRSVTLCLLWPLAACAHAPRVPVTDVDEATAELAREQAEADAATQTQPAATHSETPAAVAPDARPEGAVLRAEITRAMGTGPAWVLRELNPEPARDARGQFVGWRIGAMYPDDPSLCARCELRVGDVVTQVNDVRIARPEHLIDAIERVRRESTLRVSWLRDGETHTRSYPIVEAP